MNNHALQSLNLSEINLRFGDLSPDSLLEWAFDTFAPRIALATGFGPSGITLMHMATRIFPEVNVFYIDTDLHFPETYALRDRLMDRFGIQFTVVRSDLSLEEQEKIYGPHLWARDPDRCCQIRKVQPLQRFLTGQDAWITGIRRDQAPTRLHAERIEWDSANDLIKINPLVDWTSEQVWSYVYRHGLPYNDLHDESYPSIGCMPCTRAVAPGEDERAGRWSGRIKTECGIHSYWNPGDKKAS